MRKYNTDLTSRAKELRANSTSAERALWQHLRRQQFEGMKFRRQQPIGPFIVDFYCPALNLAIELDGDSHGDKELYDRQRQEHLESLGITVLRFWNSDVNDNLEGVLQTIYDICHRDT